MLKAAEELLMELDTPDEITTRQIAAKAGTNPAMINYCFRSKDELLNMAIGKIIQEAAENWRGSVSPQASPLQRLWNMLWKLCELVLKFWKFTKLSVPYALLQGEIELPFYILPLIREHFGNQKSETECRVVAYQLLSFIQLVYYRAESFQKYCEINVMQPDEAKHLLEAEFKLFFKGDFVSE